MSTDRIQAAARTGNEDLLCGTCGQANPAANNFCGNCGQRLAQAIEDPGSTAASDAPAPHSANYFFDLEPRAEPAGQSRISGPSFLGLSDPPDFEEERQSHVGRWLLTLAVVGIFVVGIAKWKSVRSLALHYRSALASAVAPGREPLTAAPQGQTPPVADQSPVPSTPGLQPAPPEPAQGTDIPGESAKASAAPPASPEKAQSDGQQTPSEPKNSAEDSTAAEAGQAKTSETRTAVAVPKPRRKKPARIERTRAAEPPKPAAMPGSNLVVAGEKHLYGRGAPRNCNQALVYFRSAAEVQNPRAMSHLGSLYATGTCVRRDRVQAYRWFSQALAEERSNHFLEQNLTMLWRDMSPAEKQAAMGRR